MRSGPVTKSIGRGLGLATSFSVVRRHGDWIEVESEQGQGTTFHVFLPASAQPAPQTGTGTRAIHHGSGSILVMDNEQSIGDVMRVMLTGMGYAVVLTGNGDQALAQYNDRLRSGTPFSCAILDLTIPGSKGGREVVAEIRQINPGAIVIASSGYADDPVMTNPQEHGFTARLVKPFRQAELAQLLNELFPNKR